MSSALDRIRSSRDEFLSHGKYYEALQLYKTIYNRLLTKKSYNETIVLLLDGAKQLLSYKQGNAGGELANSLIDTYNKAKQPITDVEINNILALFWSFPPESTTASVAFMVMSLIPI
jgi:hypothetical protein